MCSVSMLVTCIFYKVYLLASENRQYSLISWEIPRVVSDRPFCVIWSSSNQQLCARDSSSLTRHASVPHLFRKRGSVTMRKVEEDRQKQQMSARISINILSVSVSNYVSM